MESQFELFAAAALKLTLDEREALAQLLAASLDEDGIAEEALAAEVARRVADLDSGATKVMPMAEALDLARTAACSPRALG